MNIIYLDLLIGERTFPLLAVPVLNYLNDDKKSHIPPSSDML